MMDLADIEHPKTAWVVSKCLKKEAVLEEL